MKKLRVAAISILLTFVVLLTGCQVWNHFTSSPEKTVYGFLTAINKKDINKALEYIEPSQSKGITAMFTLAGDLMGFDLNALIDMMPLMSQVVDETGGQVEINYEITNIEEGEEEAWVTGIEHNSGEEMSFYLVMEDNKWYIYIEDL